MTTKSLKKITQILNRNEGFSIVAIIALMIVMAVMGGVFSSMMGRWQLSSPAVIHSSRAHYLAETAAMFALQDASNRFFSKTAGGVPIFPSDTTGTRLAPYTVISNSTETAEYWIERPASSVNPTVDVYPGTTDRGLNDDINTGSGVDVTDDDDDDSDTDLYTIIATGKALRDGATVATRQIKIKATITNSSGSPVAPGIHTMGTLSVTGPELVIENPSTTDTVTYNNTGPFAIDSGDDTNLVYYPSDPGLDENVFRALAQDQGHYFSGGFPTASLPDPYPSSSFYFDAPTDTIPNVTFIEGNFAINGNDTYNGLFYIKGSTTSTNGAYTINGILISTGNISLNGSPDDPDINGGIIHTGSTITSNGNNGNIDVNVGFFSALDFSIPIVNVVSWQEAVSAN